MKLLWDTHCFLWFIMGDKQMSPRVRQLIETEGNQSLLSVASLWEIAIKISIGKLTLGQPFEILIPHQLASNGIQILNIAIEHFSQVSSLPFHHRDPFDRLIIAQAIVEKIPVLSIDAVFDNYAVQRVW